MVEASIELLQVMFQRSLDGQALILSKLGEAKHRLSTLAMSVAGVKRDFASLAKQIAGASFRSDRIERRLELSDLL